MAGSRSVHGHVQLFAGTAPSGRPVHEEVPAELVGPGVYEVVGSPGLATGCAAGDHVRVRSDGHFGVVRRGGNLCLVIYPKSPPDDEAMDTLRAGFDGLGGLVEAPEDRKFIVVTVPVSVGFPAVEGVVTEWARLNDAGWQYGNVYDERDRPLGWWERGR